MAAQLKSPEGNSLETRTKEDTYGAKTRLSEQAWADRTAPGCASKSETSGVLPHLDLISQVSSEGSSTRLELPPAGSERHSWQADSPSAARHIVRERSHLLTLLDKNTGPAQQELNRDRLSAFEVRARKNCLSQEEVSDTYQQISRILKTSGDRPLTPPEKWQLAQEVIANCADPTIISQGRNPTCNVTAIESRLYALHPSRAANLLAQVAESGSYVTAGGVKVKLGALDLRPGWDETLGDPQHNHRTYATQLFNLAAINVWYSAMEPGYRYQRYAKADGNIYEGLVELKATGVHPVKEADGTIVEGPRLDDDRMAFINQAIVGHKDPFAVLHLSDIGHLPAPGERVSPVRAMDIQDEEHLNLVLNRLKTQHQLPAIAGVTTAAEPLFTDIRGGLNGNPGGHVVNVVDYQSGKQPHVSLDNEWSTAKDHLDNSVKLHDLFECMGDTNTLKLHSAIASQQARLHGTSDPAAELTELRARFTFNDKRNYLNDATAVVAGNAQRERQLKGEDRNQWLKALAGVLTTLEVAQRVPFLKTVHESKVCTNAEFSNLMGWGRASLRASRHHEPTAAANRDFSEFLTSLPPALQSGCIARMRQLVWQ